MGLQKGIQKLQELQELKLPPEELYQRLHKTKYNYEKQLKQQKQHFEQLYHQEQQLGLSLTTSDTIHSLPQQNLWVPKNEENNKEWFTKKDYNPYKDDPDVEEKVVLKQGTLFTCTDLNSQRDSLRYLDRHGMVYNQGPRQTGDI